MKGRQKDAPYRFEKDAPYRFEKDAPYRFARHIDKFLPLAAARDS